MIDPFSIWTIRQTAPRDWGALIDYDQPIWNHPTRGPIPAPTQLDFQGYCFHYWGGETLAGAEGDPDPGWTRREKIAYWLGRTKVTARSGEHYHIYSKGWRGGAYCAVISPWTGHLLRWRGFRDNGGQLGAVLNHTLLAVAWCGGGTQRPRKTAMLTFARMWLEYPGPVTCHCDTEGANTACPGPWWIPWVRSEGWLSLLSGMRRGTVGGRVVSLTERLRRLSYLERKYRRFNRTVEDAVKTVQTEAGLPADGRVDVPFLRYLAGKPRV